MKLTKKQKFQFSVSVMVFILVFAITWQIKGVQKTSNNNNIEVQLSNLSSSVANVQNYKALLDKNQDLQEQLEIANNDKARYREQIAQSGNVSEILKEDLARAEMAAGLTDVSGSGITVTLSDGEKPSADGMIYNEDYGIVHDATLLSILNELRAAGAEAIAINDERVLATSEVRCAGPTVMINKTPKSAPFKIEAIGDPETMENALKMPGGAVEEAIFFYGVDINIQKSNKLVIPKYTGVVSYKHAQTVQPEVTE